MKGLDISLGYVSIYNPEHHRARKNGHVYEHILVAEKKLKRKLKKGEVVHHEDENRSNNDEDNITVFETSADHMRYHSTGVRIKVEDYYVSPNTTKEKRKCEICGRNFVYYKKSQTGKYWLLKEVCREVEYGSLELVYYSI